MRKGIAREAKALVALASKRPDRGGPCGATLPNLHGQRWIFRITDEEMKVITKNAVDKLYALLVLKLDNPAEYERKIEFGARYTTKWNGPTIPPER